MPSDLRSELKQHKPFTSIEEEAALSIARTAAILGHAFAEAMREHGLTGTQYNVLRILRGAGKDGLCRNDVRDRLIAQVPDVTRLLDRMEEAGLIERARDAADRRLVSTRITERGLKLVDSLDQPVYDLNQRMLGHLTRTQLRTLVDLLAIVREPR